MKLTVCIYIYIYMCLNIQSEMKPRVIFTQQQYVTLGAYVRAVVDAHTHMCVQLCVRCACLHAAV